MNYVLLPAYNEEAGLSVILPALVRIAPPGQFRVIVVDDGSRDRTSEVAASFKGPLDLRLIRFDNNRGVSEVFYAGMNHIIEDSRDPGNDACVVLDADGTQDPLIMLPMIKAVNEQGADIVIASRFVPGGGMIGCPLPRTILSYGTSWLLRLVVRLPGVKDYSVFFKTYRVSVLKAGFARYGRDILNGRGFSGICGMLIKLGNVTDKITEIPLMLRYDLKGGSSGMRILRTMRGYLELVWRCLLTGNFRRA